MDKGKERKGIPNPRIASKLFDFPPEELPSPLTRSTASIYRKPSILFFWLKV